MFLFCAAALLTAAGLVSCSSSNDSGQEAAMPTPSGATKYLLKYRVLSSDTLLDVKYVLSGNGLLLADTSYSGISGSRYFYETRELTYGDRGLSAMVYKRYKADGTIDNTYNGNNYTVNYTYSGNTIREKASYEDGFENLYYIENGKVVKVEEVGDTDVDKYYYTGSNCTKVEYFDGATLEATQVNEFDDKKNPFYNNCFAFYDEALGENNTKKRTRTYPDDASIDVDFNVEYLGYNSQGYPTMYQDKGSNGTGTTLYMYQYIGW